MHVRSESGSCLDSKEAQFAPQSLEIASLLPGCGPQGIEAMHITQVSPLPIPRRVFHPSHQDCPSLPLPLAPLLPRDHSPVGSNSVAVCRDNETSLIAQKSLPQEMQEVQEIQQRRSQVVGETQASSPWRTCESPISTAQKGLQREMYDRSFECVKEMRALSPWCASQSSSALNLSANWDTKDRSSDDVEEMSPLGLWQTSQSSFALKLGANQDKHKSSSLQATFVGENRIGSENKRNHVNSLDNSQPRKHEPEHFQIIARSSTSHIQIQRLQEEKLKPGADVGREAHITCLSSRSRAVQGHARQARHARQATCDRMRNACSVPSRTQITRSHSKFRRTIDAICSGVAGFPEASAIVEAQKKALQRGRLRTTLGNMQAGFARASSCPLCQMRGQEIRVAKGI